MQECNIGDLLEGVTRGIIVQQVNAQGVMGSGFAKAIRDRWPVVFDKYIAHVGPAYTQKDSGLHLLGQVISVEVGDDLIVANIVGQQFFGRKDGHRYTSYDALDSGFKCVYALAEATGLPVHYPMIGAGLGGGNWSIISAIINANLDTIHHTLWVHPDFAYMMPR